MALARRWLLLTGSGVCAGRGWSLAQLGPEKNQAWAAGPWPERPGDDSGVRPGPALEGRRARPAHHLCHSRPPPRGPWPATTCCRCFFVRVWGVRGPSRHPDGPPSPVRIPRTALGAGARGAREDTARDQAVGQQLRAVDNAARAEPRCASGAGQRARGRVWFRHGGGSATSQSAPQAGWGPQVALQKLFSVLRRELATTGAEKVWSAQPNEMASVQPGRGRLTVSLPRSDTPVA
ncbi:uncharacterized protein LOC119060593 [Artibeus jamaicensis]|uniref:uncharacterized protein LOC119060593 n=1 Tax=Artibeus jamaicensis TaxID=9417 RepID=UPI00235A5DE4|nr:uncharacterized protein LOC119060593 [Artibeus jamaicensis]